MQKGARISAALEWTEEYEIKAVAYDSFSLGSSQQVSLVIILYNILFLVYMIIYREVCSVLRMCQQFKKNE